MRNPIPAFLNQPPQIKKQNTYSSPPHIAQKLTVCLLSSQRVLSATVTFSLSHACSKKVHNSILLHEKQGLFLFIEKKIIEKIAAKQERNMLHKDLVQHDFVEMAVLKG